MISVEATSGHKILRVRWPTNRRAPCIFSNPKEKNPAITKNSGMMNASIHHCTASTEALRAGSISAQLLVHNGTLE